MEVFFKKIDEENKLLMDKPSGCDMIYYSELNEWFTNNAFRNFSVKYVIDGTIHYKGHAFSYPVKKNEILIAQKQPGIIAQFDSLKNKTKSICIDISPESINEVFTCLIAEKPGDLVEELISHRYKNFQLDTEVLNMEEFEGKSFLKSIASGLNRFGKNERVSKEWVYDLAEHIIIRNARLQAKLKLLKSIKVSTRKEIIRRLLVGKSFIDENFMSIRNISEVAVHCAMSEYHFMRTFKQALQISPYQYLLKKKLEWSIKLIREKDLFLSDIAIQCGFPDLATYSKAFKRMYHICPSMYRSNI